VSSTKYKFDLQGHRGARGLRPENSLPAFLLALELGVTTLELDVVISRDKKVVVSHDPWFNPLVSALAHGIDASEDMQLLKIYDLTYDQIRQINVGAKQHPLFPRQIPLPVYKPLLSEVFAHSEAFSKEIGRDPVSYNIETKSTVEGDGTLHPKPEEFVDLLLTEIDSAGVSERTTLQSFDQRTLISAKDRRSPVTFSLLVDSMESGNLESRIARLGFQPEIFSPDYKLVDEALVADAKRLGVEVLPWTVNTREQMIRLLEMGVDGIITDYPDLGVTLLDRA
jgi:glycerophosphoryl diester phosphodiesterase